MTGAAENTTEKGAATEKATDKLAAEAVANAAANAAAGSANKADAAGTAAGVLPSQTEPPVPGDWDTATGLWHGGFSGHQQFAQIVRAALQAAHEQSWSEIIVCDTDFVTWPFAERAVSELLNQWSMTGRRFTLLARNYRQVQSQQHRLVEWRRRWAHIVTAHACQQHTETDFPSVFWSPQWTCQRVHQEYSKGYAGSEGWRLTAVREQLDELLANSTPAFPASVLGL